MVGWNRSAKINVKVVIILLVVLVAIVASLFVARYARRRILSRMDLNAGNAAYEKEPPDWSTAAEHFQEYLGRNPDDLEILKKYAESRMHIRPLDARAIGGAASAYRRIIRNEPNDVETYDQLAEIYTYTGQSEELKYIAEKRLEQDFPGEQKAPLWLATALVRLDRAEEAKTELEKYIAELEKVEDKPDEYVQACVLMSQIILSDDSDDSLQARQDRAKQALELLTKAVEGVPESAEALVTRARFYRASSDIPGMSEDDRLTAARADLEAADELGTEDPSIRGALCAEWIAHGNYEEADTELRAGYYEKADAKLRTVENLSQEVMDEHFFDVNDWTSTRFMLAAELELRKGDPNEAAKLADDVLSDLTETRHRLRVLDPAIISYVSVGRPADANDCLDEYIDATRGAGLTTQGRLRLAFLRALVARAQNRPYAVIDILQPVLVDDVRDPKLWQLLAEAYQRANQPSRAADALTKYLSLQPEDSRATLQLAEQYLKLGDWSKVFEHAQRVESLDPNDIVGRLLRIEAGVRLATEREGGVDTARLAELSSELAKLRQTYPDRVDIRTLQAIIAVNTGQRVDAEEELKTAISKAEGSLKLRAEMQLARYYYGEKRIADAISTCKEACARDPNVGEPWRLLANFQTASGDPNSARTTLEQGLAAVAGESEKRTLAIQLATLELARGGDERAKAIEQLTELAAEDKQDMRIRLLLLGIREVLEDPNEAQQLVDELKAAEGESGFRWRYHQASLWLSSDDWRSKQREITDALQYCIDAEPAWSTPALMLAATYERLNDLQSAEGVYRRALARNPAAIQIADRLTNVLRAQGKLSDPDEILNMVKASSEAKNALELKTALGSGDLDRAIRKLKERLSKDSKDVNAQIKLAELVYLKNRDFEEANEYLKAAESIDPNSVYLITTQVGILKADGQAEAARTVLDDYVTKTNSFNAYMVRALYLAGEGELEDAEKDYQKLKTLTDLSAAGYVQLSNYIANHDLDKAVEWLKEGLDAYPEDSSLERAWMKTLLRRNSKEDRVKALDILGKLEGQLPDDIELLSIRASLLLAAKSTEEAKKKLERIIELNPRAVNAHLMLIDMASKRGDLENARDLVIQALGSNPDNSMLLSVRSRIELAAGDKQLAAQLARLAIPDLKTYCESKDGSGNVETIVLLADMYRITGDFNTAKQRIEQAEQLDPNSPTVLNAYINLALTLYQEGDAESAKQIYQKLLEQYADEYPQNIRIFNDLAWILQEHDNDYAAALELANKGTNVAREDTEKLHLLDTRGTILFKMNRFTDARADFEALVVLSPPDSERMAKALLQLGRTCKKLNESDKVNEHLNKALEIDGKINVFTPEERSEIDQLMK